MATFLDPNFVNMAGSIGFAVGAILVAAIAFGSICRDRPTWLR